jgi:hypothetical protein
MAAAKTSTTTINPLLKTYSGRPVPFQFPNSQEKMYIGSEVSGHVLLYSIKSAGSYRKRTQKKKRVYHHVYEYLCVSSVCLFFSRWATTYVYFVERFIKNIQLCGGA